MPDGTITLTPEIKHAGDPGFEWGEGYSGDAGGIRFVRQGALVFVYGAAKYTGSTLGSLVCKIPPDWRDDIGNDKPGNVNSDPDQSVILYVSGSDDGGLSIAKGPGDVSADGYLTVLATCWAPPAPAVA